MRRVMTSEPETLRDLDVAWRLIVLDGMAAIVLGL